MADLITMLSAVAGQQGEEVDEDFNQTVLLLHGDGTNGAQNNTFLDSSTNNFTITRNGNTTQGTFSPFSLAAGQWSNYFDGSGDYLSVPDNAALEIGASSFCIEAWVYLDALTTNTSQVVLGKWVSNQYSYIFQIQNSSGTIRFAFSYTTNGSTSVDLFQSASITANTWHHVAVTRDSTTVRFFLDGVQQGGTQTANATFYNGTAAVEIGRNGDNASLLKGYISNCRLVIGSAVYTSSFTPSTSPLTAITNTSLLTCQSNRFVDNSSNAFAITRNGDVRVTPFSPFAPTTAYSAGTNGGSGYFDGTGDYLNITSTEFDVPTGDWTAEAWIYPTAALATQSGVSYIIASNAADITSASNLAWFLRIVDSSGYKIQTGVVQSSSATTVNSVANVKLNEWQHVAAVRDGNNFYVYLNGVRASTTASVTINTQGRAFIGGAVINGSASGTFPGYIADARFVKGTAVYTAATITPPTAPLTAIANTELLCNFTNAGIIDNTGKNNLETVADAQIDTTTKKYGTGSMEFDGTGDWLLMAHNPDQQLGTGNFTIEFWVYLASGDTGSARGLVAKGTSTTGFLVSLDSSQKVVFTFTTSTITSSGAITTNAWNHIAVVRSGTGSNQTKIYINGTNDGTGTVSTDFNQTSVMYVGCNRTAGDPMKGFIDDLRITKGVARYTANYSAPGKAFPDF